jgi:WD40 repeat protein
MGIPIAVFLLLLAIAIFVVKKKGLIDNKTLETLADIAGIIAFLAAILVFVIPQPSVQETEVMPTSTVEIPEAQNWIPSSTETKFPINTLPPETAVPQIETKQPTEQIKYTPSKVEFATPTSTNITILAPILVENANKVKNVGQIIASGFSLDFSPDGEYLITPSTNGVILYETRTWGKIQEYVNLSRTRSLYATFSNDGKYVASIDFHGNVRIWEMSPNKYLNFFGDIKDEDAKSIKFSPSTFRIAIGNYSGSIRIWSLVDGSLVAELLGHTDTVNTLEFPGNDEVILSGSSDKTIKIWDLEDGSSITRDTGSPVLSVTFSPVDNIFTSALSDGYAQIWEFEDFTQILTLAGHSDSVNGVAFSPDGTLLVTVSKDKTIRLWRVEDGALLAILNSQFELFDVVFSPDGTILVSIGWEGAQLWAVSND